MNADPRYDIGSSPATGRPGTAGVRSILRTASQVSHLSVEQQCTPHQQQLQQSAYHQPRHNGARSVSRSASVASRYSTEPQHAHQYQQQQQQLSADCDSDILEVNSASIAGSQTSQYGSWRMQPQQTIQEETESTAYMPLPVLGTPGPGAYDHPSSFL